jgi:serine/threonine protein phosphatase PrpC
MSLAKYNLSRAMGFDLRVNVDYQTFNLEVNDQFLMTTDGVHDYSIAIDSRLAYMKNMRSVGFNDDDTQCR